MNRQRKKTVQARRNSAKRNSLPRKNRPQQSAITQFDYSRNEMELVMQRYVDLYDFAPVAYVNIDRVGRIEKLNLASCELLGRSRQHLIGFPLMAFVISEDRSLFLNHLLRCRNANDLVQTEMRMKN